MILIIKFHLRFIKIQHLLYLAIVVTDGSFSPVGAHIYLRILETGIIV